MDFIGTLFGSVGYFDLPQGWSGWLVWFALLTLNVYLMRQWRKFHKPNSRLRSLILVALLILIPAATSFFGLKLPAPEALPVPGRALIPSGAILMFFAALPWCLAAGFAGPGWSGILAGLSGLLLGYFDTHNLFTPLIYWLVGMMFGLFIRQQYRTLPYRIMRQPAAAGVTVTLAYALLFLVSTILVTGDVLVVRLDYAVSQLPVSLAAFAGQMAMGVLFAQVLAVLVPKYWSGTDAFEPSPSEASLESNLVYRLLPLVGVFSFLVLVGLGVLLAEQHRQQLIGQMEDVAQASAASIPFSLETGQNLIVQLAADPELLAAEDPVMAQAVLVEYLRRVPFFNQLTYLDADQQLVAAYPVDNLEFLFLTVVERQAIEYALSGIGYQSYSLEPEPGDDISRLVFVAAVQKPDGERGVILGRTTLDTNPFFIPVLETLDTLAEIGGAGVLVDEQGMVLYHSDPDLIWTKYPSEIDPTSTTFHSRVTASDGSRQMVFTYPVPGRSWAVVTSVPLAVPQQTALELTLSLLLMLAALLAILFWALRLSVRSVIDEIGKLAADAEEVASGELDKALRTDQVNEVGQLAQAVDGMRVRLKARMVEVDQLLAVSKGVASSLDLKTAIEPVLAGALSTGASAARLALADNAAPEFEAKPRMSFGAGPSARQYLFLDHQILALTLQRPEISQENPARERHQSLGNPMPRAILTFALEHAGTHLGVLWVGFDEPHKSTEEEPRFIRGRARLQSLGNPMPRAILAFALEHEGTHLGVLWVGFDEPHKFTEDETRFIRALAGQAALAVSNARLFLSAQLGRQRMEAILASTPEPVIVTDSKKRLLLVNPAAQDLLQQDAAALAGKEIEEVVSQIELRRLLTADDLPKASAPIEVSFPNDRTYFASVSPVVLEEGELVGRVCLLRDITYYKQLDELKSDFLETVNHDLRHPLTTVSGYATMLEMVGDLNEQQSRYTRKIIQSVESMSRLVNTLLDIEEINAGFGLKLDWISPAEIVRQVAEALQLTAVQKRMTIETILPEATLPLIRADAALLERALINLVENAIKYTEPGGQVSITVRPSEGEQVAIAVRDTGTGISPVDIPRLFERFYRGVNRKTKNEPGSGLGLSIVKSIIDRHHGSIKVDSRLGQGSTFTVLLPIRQPEDKQSSASGRPE